MTVIARGEVTRQAMPGDHVQVTGVGDSVISGCAKPCGYVVMLGVPTNDKNWLQTDESGSSF